MKYDILMFGVGGQGTVLSSDIVCEVALESGFDAKKSEIHGMAQRGGSVVSHVRIAEKVFSPVIALGEADILVSFEHMEFLRYIEYASENSTLILNTNKIFPPGVLSGKEEYPDKIIRQKLKLFKYVKTLDALDIAKSAGNMKVAGMAVVGALARMLPFKKDVWENVIKGKVPSKTIESNIKAFNMGYNI
jgi:indolepyruvate ferredoxin oxidoreductase beta subunit